jgi:autotransporter-associated beta strand protein
VVTFNAGQWRDIESTETPFVINGTHVEFIDNGSAPLLAGPITINGGKSLTFSTDLGTPLPTSFSGPLAGQGDLVVGAGVDFWIFAEATTSLTGAMHVVGGTLHLDRFPGYTAVAGPLDIGAQGVVEMEVGEALETRAYNLGLTVHPGKPGDPALYNQIADSSVVTVSGGGRLNLRGFSETIGGLAGEAPGGNVGIVSNASTTAGALTVQVPAGVSRRFAGTIEDGVPADPNDPAAPLALVKTGKGEQVLAGPCTFSGGTTVRAGTLKIDSGAGGSVTGDLAFEGTAVFHCDSTSAAGPRELGLGALRFIGGDGTVRSTGAPGRQTTVTFSALAPRTAGATGNFIVSGSPNGVENRIVVLAAPPASRFLDQGLFFGGDAYAAYDAGGFLRAMNYTSDNNGNVAVVSSGQLADANDKHVDLTASMAQQGSANLMTLRISGVHDLGLGADQVLMLSKGGLLKSGNSPAAITGSGAAGITSGPTELVVRTDQSDDSLTIAVSILETSVAGLTKSGLGTLVLAAANHYAGDTTVNAGTLRAAHVSAFPSGSGLVIAAGATLEVEPGLNSGTSWSTAHLPADASAAPSRPAPVPEPSTVALLAAAAVLVFARRARRSDLGTSRKGAKTQR